MQIVLYFSISSLICLMLAHPRVAGIKMNLEVQKFFPWDERLFPLYEMIINRDKILYGSDFPSPPGVVFFAPNPLGFSSCDNPSLMA